MKVNEDIFKKWLMRKGLKDTTSSDVISRCKRVERTFGISLDKELSTIGKTETLINKLKKESSRYLRPSTNKIFAVGVLCSAVKHYREYLISRKGK